MTPDAQMVLLPNLKDQQEGASTFRLLSNTTDDDSEAFKFLCPIQTEASLSSNWAAVNGTGMCCWLLSSICVKLPKELAHAPASISCGYSFNTHDDALLCNCMDQHQASELCFPEPLATIILFWCGAVAIKAFTTHKLNLIDEASSAATTSTSCSTSAFLVLHPTGGTDDLTWNLCLVAAGWCVCVCDNMCDMCVYVCF